MNPLEIKGQSQKGTVLTKSLISQPLIDLEYKTWYEINVKTMHYSKLWPDLLFLLFLVSLIFKEIFEIRGKYRIKVNAVYLQNNSYLIC